MSKHYIVHLLTYYHLEKILNALPVHFLNSGMLNSALSKKKTL